MTASSAAPGRPSILYSCYYNQSRSGEQFVAEHALSFQLSGTLITHDGSTEQVFRAGDLRLVKRNHLVKFNKQPPENGVFKSLSVTLDQETLRRFSLEHGYHAEKPHDSGHAVLELQMNPLYKSYLASLQPYEHLTEPGNEGLLALKLREAILLLLKSNPELKEVLFDFSDPGKLDLEAFMSRNFHFNVQLRRFAYLTAGAWPPSSAILRRSFTSLLAAGCCSADSRRPTT
ncbi:AraC family transcriptional regulator [Hymenobacter wooponensis]|uniref:AraC family transcriptional regulator n=1 Tax=Hymenobacter wooponensis TaxID=1525360 RepID=UPI001FDAC044|nr:AraC family transcriptional regulator [Hymenobacter wooponensis]